MRGGWTHIIYEKIGPVEIMGDQNSQVPLSTSLIIAGSEYATVIDCGAGYKTFDYMRQEHNVQQIYLTHHHIDHTWGAHLFPDVQKLINPYELKTISDVQEIGQAEGAYAVFGDKGIEKWIQEQQNRKVKGKLMGKRTLEVTDSYPYNETMDLSGVNVTFIHAPGHTVGYCIPYIEDYGILHVGDIDLTSFGPFYCGAEGDIDQFIPVQQKKRWKWMRNISLPHTKKGSSYRKSIKGISEVLGNY